MEQRDRITGIPERGIFAVEEDALARKRKELAERLKNGQNVTVSEDGELLNPETPEGQEKSIGGKIPDGKLAAEFHWYIREPKLLEAEEAAMKRSFPQFKLDKLDDGRLFWTGTLYPMGRSGISWTLMAIYDHNHPNNSTYGGSIRVYSIDPDIDKLQRELGAPLPHVINDGNGRIYMCTARKEDFQAGRVVTSAAQSLRWALKWTFTVSCWLDGQVGNEIYDYTY